MYTAGSPAADRPSYSQALSEHASRPIRSTASPRPWKKVTSASGSLATRASFAIRPSSSTTQMAVSSSDTSRPAKCFTAAPPRCSWPMHTGHAPPSWAEQPPPGREPQSLHLSHGHGDHGRGPGAERGGRAPVHLLPPPGGLYPPPRGRLRARGGPGG